MPTVLFLIDTLQTGGAEKSLLDILSRFKKYKAVICHIYPGDELKEKFEANGIKVVSLNIQGKYNYAEAADRIVKLIQEYKPVMIHSTLYKSDMISRILKSKTGLPLVNSFVNNGYSKTRYKKTGITGKLKLFLFQLRDMFTARAVDLFISNSETIKMSNAAALKIPEKKITVIFRGRSFDKFQHPDIDRMNSLTEKYDLKGKLLIVNVSRLLQRKGQLDLLAAFSEIRKTIPAAILLIAGEGNFREQLEKKIHELNMEDSVVLPGAIDHIPELLALADCFVFPTYYEGLPGALIEAMMAKKIIIASDIPENRECIDETSALFFKPGDQQHLALLMKQVLSGLDEYKSYAEHAQAISREKFAIDRVAAKYEQVYDQLLGPEV